MSVEGEGGFVVGWCVENGAACWWMEVNVEVNVLSSFVLEMAHNPNGDPCMVVGGIYITSRVGPFTVASLVRAALQ